ncbi:MAG: bacillithiol biosynthesis deacetylase BshB1 [Ignavibacteria bacterium]|nr:MAG: bacillithiol biosynthesis deacetylase BshB1 [Ignavibacteria bacterium]
MEAAQTVDVLAFSPHPDDAELYCSGTLLLLKRGGFRIGITDLTEGELSTRGTVETRRAETADASRILELDYRGNLRLPDGGIANTTEQRLAVVREIRSLRPRTVFLPYPHDRHPDHENASVLVREALFAAGLRRLSTTDAGGNEQEAWRPGRSYYYMLTEEFEPQAVVDISDVHETKFAAIRAYATQFGLDDSVDPETYISRPEFLQSLIGRSQRLGFHVGGTYAEGFLPLHKQRFEAEWLLS